MSASNEAARRRRLAFLLLLPLCAGIGFRWYGEIYLFVYRLIPFGKIPLPAITGVYGIENDQLVKIGEGAPILNFQSSVEFVCYYDKFDPAGKWYVTPLPYRTPNNPHNLTNPWNRWIRAIEDFDNRSHDLRRRITNSDSGQIECTIKSFVGQDNMIRLTPAAPIQPGVYALVRRDIFFTEPFFVNLDRLRTDSLATVRKAMEEKRWEDALQEADGALVLSPDDPSLQQDIEDIRIRLAVSAAQEALRANERRDADRAMALAARLRPDDSELLALQGELDKQRAEMLNQKAAQETKVVEQKKEWDDLLAAAKVGSKVTPVDEGPSDRSFVEFRTKLSQAVEKKDSRALLAVVDQNIVNATREESGKQRFLTYWTPDDPASDLWWQLAVILKSGGRFNADKTTFTAPFVYTDYRASFEYHQAIGVVVGTDVSVRSEPRAKSRLLTRLSRVVVPIQFGERPWFDDFDGGPIPWFLVTIPNSEEGYMSAQYLRSPLDYHAIFKQAGDRWVLEELAHEWPQRGD